MRRRLEIFIPIVLFAMMVQLFAPIGAFRAVAYAVSDPLHMAAICSGMASSQDASPEKRAQAPHGANCCGFCSVGHSGAVALDSPPPLVHVALQRQYRLIAWLEAVDHIPPARAGAHAQARAPPSIPDLA
jgi:hypothetical protein